MVGQSARHTDELSPCAEKGAGAGAVERLDVNGPIPTGANELSQAPRVVLIRLIDLHFKSGTRVLGLKPHNFGPRLRSSCTIHGVIALSIDPYAGVISRIPTHHSFDLFWNGRAPAPPQPPTGIVDRTDGGQLLRNIQATKMGYRSVADLANHRASPPGSRHFRRITRRQRLSDVQT